MRRLFVIFILLFSICVCTFAKGNHPLRIAVTHFSPPFAIQNSSSNLSGFDIDLMMYICKTINRPCEFIPMKSSQIFASIINKQADLGVGGINISNSTNKLIKFSIPYMLSEYRILSNKPYKDVEQAPQILKNKTIGMTKNSLVKDKFLNFASLNNMKIIEFANTSQLISALNDEAINFAIVKNATAIYWQNNSAGGLYTLGEPLDLGLNIGIPINFAQRDLMKSINKAILNYKNSPEYQRLYSMYFGIFS